MYDSLKYTKELEGAGFSRKQAEKNIEIMTSIINSNLASKQDLKDLGLATSQDFQNLRSGDLKDLRTELKTDIANLRTELKADIASLKLEMSELRAETKQLALKMTIVLGSIMTVGIGILAALIRLQ